MNPPVSVTTRRLHSPVFPVSMLVLVLLPLLLLPLAAVFVFAFRGGAVAFLAALKAPDAQFALRFSIVMAFATASVNAVIGTFAAYVLSKYSFRGKRPLNIVVNLPVAIPTVVVATSLLLLWGPIGLLGRWLEPLGLQPMFTPAGVLLAHIFVTFPYMLGAVKPLLDELETTYEEAAYTIGASRWQTFWHVILPAMRPILEFVAVVTTIGVLTSMFGLIYVLTAGGPGTSTTLPEFLIWMEQGKMNRPGYASAISMVLFVGMAGLAYVQIRIMSRNANS